MMINKIRKKKNQRIELNYVQILKRARKDRQTDPIRMVDANAEMYAHNSL